jgi:hypothetical protein
MPATLTRDHRRSLLQWPVVKPFSGGEVFALRELFDRCLAFRKDVAVGRGWDREFLLQTIRRLRIYDVEVYDAIEAVLFGEITRFSKFREAVNRNRSWRKRPAWMPKTARKEA